MPSTEPIELEMPLVDRSNDEGKFTSTSKIRLVKLGAASFFDSLSELKLAMTKA